MFFFFSKRLHVRYFEIVAGSMTALPASGGMVGEYDMSSRGHSYDFATATLSAEDVNVSFYHIPTGVVSLVTFFSAKVF